MKNFRYFPCIILLASLLSATAVGKEKTDSLAYISGRITDAADPLSKITAFSPVILLVTSEDGGKTDSLYTTSDYKGVFHFRNIKPQTIYLKISCLGRKTIEGTYTLEAGQNAFFFTMEEAPEKLEESKVTAEATLMKQIGDTTIYNAAAVKTMDGETLRAMLEQLPGFKVSKDGISVRGQEIKRTYINGILVFGDNPITAVDALKADEVAQVRVYDEQNEIDKRRGLKHSRKDRVLDVVTKEPILRLTEAGIVASGGADETGQARYGGLAIASYHSEMLQLNGFAYAENIGSQIGSDNSSYSSNGITPFMNSFDDGSALSSYRETAGAQVRTSKYWKDRRYGNSVHGEYRYWRKYEKSASTVLSEYFASGGDPTTTSEDSSSYRSVTGIHSAEVRFDLMDTPLKSIGAHIFADISDNRNSSFVSNNSVTGDIVNSRHETSGSDRRDYSARVILDWTNNDAVKVRPFVRADFTFANNNSLAWTVDTLATSFDRRKLDSDGFGNSVDGRLNFNLSSTLVNNMSRTLTFSGGFSSVYNRSRTKTLTVDEFEGMEIDLANTYDNTWNNLTNSIDISMDYNTRKVSMSGRVSLQNVLQIDDEKYPLPPYSLDTGTGGNLYDAISWDSYSSHRNYWTVSPSFELRHRDLSVSVSASSSVPSLEQTRNRISDANPLMLTGGNPDLKPSYSTDIKANYRKMFAKGMGYINMSLYGNSTFRQIVTKTEYFSENTVLSAWDGYEALAGARLNTFENSDVPAWRTGLDLSGMGMVLKRKLTISASANAAYTFSPQYIGQDLTGVNDASAGGMVNLRFVPSRKWSVSANWICNYVNSTDKAGTLLSERIIQNASANGSVNFAKYGKFNINYRICWYDYLRGIGTDFFSQSLNASISWSFLKRSLTLSLQGIDLLNSGHTYTSTVTAQSSVQTWQPVYGRYFMLSLKYVFRRK